MVEKIALYPHHVARLIKIRSKIYTKLDDLKSYAALSKEPIKKQNLDKAEFEPIEVGTVWGSDFDCGWFKFEGKVPESAKGKHVVALINIEGEGVVYINDEVKQGITQVLTGIDLVQSRKGKQVVELFKCADGGEEVNILVDAGFNGKRNKEGVKVKVQRKDIAICHDEILTYYYDYLQLVMLIITEGKNENLTKERVDSINKALNESYKLAKKDYVKAHERLLQEIIKPVNYNATEYTAIGHAHIDLAWLWPIRETKRKGVRTFATALHNIDKYDDYVFGASQAQLFDWIKQQEPQMYEKVKTAVEKNRIEIQGGMWCENDCNIPSGESIIRQFMYGEKFFKDEFNRTSKMVWLPDVFGYPASLPQIFKKCGKEYFMTIKLSWNTHNKFPYKTFIWKGIDDTSILAHMAPQGDYNSTASPMAIVKSNRNNPQKDQIDKALLIYGVGDGGGGPGEAQLEMLKRNNTEGLNVIKKRPAQEFFEELEKDCIEKIPEYKGELYLEKHQGTYTSQAKNKYYNRKIENDLHTLEWLLTIAKLNNIEYDKSRLDNIWKEVLLYQFHDIIPGSSIERVYVESVQRYEAIEKEIQEMQTFILAKIATKQKLTAINPIDFERKEYVKIEDVWYKVEVAPYSAAALLPVSEMNELKYGEDYILNDKIKVSFAQDGSINSILDRQENKELCKNYMNNLVVFSDPHMYYNAWDIRDDYRKLKTEKMKLVAFNSFVDGCEVIRENSYKYNKSSLVQRVKLSLETKLITFETIVDWHEDYKMLRAEFEPQVFSDVVNCDIQFGNVDRSTKDESSVEKAQFEICAHKFVNVDNEDKSYGIALINNCKYGHRVKEGLISLNLLRSPKYPDKNCDMGKHYFNYAIYPHVGSWNESDVVKQAYCFNNPLIISDYMVDIGNIFDLDNDSVIVETIKPSENNDGIVLRLYERYGQNAEVKFRIGVKSKSVSLVNMLEQDIEEIKTSKLTFTPYEIKTILVRF